MSDIYIRFFDKIINKSLLDLLDELDPKPTRLIQFENASGSHTIFDTILQLSTSNHRTPIPIENLTNITTSALMDEFLCQAISMSVIHDYEFDLRDIQYVSSSRDNHGKFTSLYEFGKRCYELNRFDYQNVTEDEYFLNCVTQALNHERLTFICKCWSPSLSYSNSDGSHRFATAYFMAHRDNREYRFKANLKLYDFNYEWFQRVSKIYDLYLLSYKYKDNSMLLYDIFKPINDEHTHSFIALSTWDKTNDLLHDAYFPNVQQFLVLVNRRKSRNSLLQRYLSWGVKNDKLVDFLSMLNRIEFESLVYKQKKLKLVPISIA